VEGEHAGGVRPKGLTEELRAGKGGQHRLEHT
jgi:hypothetical protein